jgi:DNA-directed RNA polymerase specialized sigma24 family protein
MTTGGRDKSQSPGEGNTPFAEFLRRIRVGDEGAAAELVSRYEPALRLEIRLRMKDPKLRRLLEPADLCQSVLKSFFVRVSAGQYDLDSPEKLLALLRKMARNKVAEQTRKQRAQRRDQRRDVSIHVGGRRAAVGRPSLAGLRLG